MNVGQLLEAIKDYDRYIDGVSVGIESISSEVATRRVESVTHDHRMVDSKTVFVAMKGTHVDSHAYIQDARDLDAAFIVGQREFESNRHPDLVVGNSRAAIGPMASAMYGFPSSKMKLVGITGTNGKTTVSYLYSSIVRALSRHCFTMGTTGILLDGEKESDSQTTPDPLIIQKYFADFLEEGVRDGAIEVSSHALDQFRVLGSYFAAVAFTNFSQDHLDYHNSMDEYFKAKRSLFTTTYSHNAVINIDDEKGTEIVEFAEKNGQKVFTVSTKDPHANVFVECKNMTLDGSELLIKITESESVENQSEEFLVKTPLIGEFNHENVAVAIGLAKATGAQMSIACSSLENPDTVPGRLQRPTINPKFAVFVDYAHTPDALKRVLETIKPLSKKLIVVFGCGGDRDQAKRPLMGKIASELADIAIVTNDNPRSEDPALIADAIVAGTTSPVRTELDRRAAIKLAISLAQAGDAIIVAGKGHEHGQVFVDRIEDFSDMDVVNELLANQEAT